MSDKKIQNSKEPKIKKIGPEEQLKWEIAREIGVYDKVLESGWKSLSAKESGRIGGILSTRKKQLSKQALKNESDEVLQEANLK